MSVFKKYRNYEGTAEVSVEDGICHGKILFIEDLVTYEAETVRLLEKEFHSAVDDYLQTCADVGKSPDKPCSGTFNVRVSPDIHRKAVVDACRAGVSLNEIVGRALSASQASDLNVSHNGTLKIQGDLSLIRAGSEPQWTNLGGNHVH